MRAWLSEIKYGKTVKKFMEYKLILCAFKTSLLSPTGIVEICLIEKPKQNS